MGGFHDKRVMESKIKEIENRKRNQVFEKVKNVGQNAVNTR